MTRTEFRILSPIARKLRKANLGLWQSLVYQIQFGAESIQFPYYPAALDFEPAAMEAVHDLPRDSKALLVKEWGSVHRLISRSTPEAILDRYGVMLMGLLISRAKAAGNRTSF